MRNLPQWRKAITSIRPQCWARRENSTIGRRGKLKSEAESLKISTTVEDTILKVSDPVIRVGRREDLKSEDESPNPSATGKINTVKGSDLKKLEVIRKYISREKTGNHDQKLIRNGGIKDQEKRPMPNQKSASHK